MALRDSPVRRAILRMDILFRNAQRSMMPNGLLKITPSPPQTNPIRGKVPCGHVLSEAKSFQRNETAKKCIKITQQRILFAKHNSSRFIQPGNTAKHLAPIKTKKRYPSDPPLSTQVRHSRSGLAERQFIPLAQSTRPRNPRITGAYMHACRSTPLVSHSLIPVSSSVLIWSSAKRAAAASRS